MAGLVNVMAWLLKVLAFKNDRASRVSPIFYLESVFALLLDNFVFDISFGYVPLLGILLVFAMFALKLVTAFKE